MSPDELRKCANLLSEVTRNFARLPTERVPSLQAAGACLLAQSYLVEIAAHLDEGMDSYDAHEAAAKGTLKVEVSASAIADLERLGAPPDL
jgi:hypothetical protein